MEILGKQIEEMVLKIQKEAGGRKYQEKCEEAIETQEKTLKGQHEN